jgi:DNA-binding transcriptional MocR family regulator
MKKIMMYVLAIVFLLCTSTVVEARSGKKIDSGNYALVVKKGEKLSDEDWNRIANRVEEIRHMDRSNMTAEERHELRQELREYQRHWRGDGYRHRGGTVVIFGGGTLILIIVLIILLA